MPDAREALEVRLDECLGFGVLHLELTRERMRALAVDGREVDRLRARPHLRCHRFERHGEDDARRLPVDVAARAERIDERGIMREMGEQPQLDLRVVRGQHVPAFTRNESPADVLAELATDRDVLEVRIARRKTSGAGHRLVERGVQSPRGRIHEQR